jgi:phosphomannomutase
MSSSVFETLETAREWWLRYDPDPETKAIIASLPPDSPELRRMLLGPRIAFGTAGLRAKLEPGFQGLNDIVVQQTAQGVAVVLGERVDGAREKGVVVGYDHRKRSRRFAEITANVFLARGFKVYLSERLCATPYVAYGVRLFGAAAGIMVTPSHNPAGDNGYKLYGSNGAQIIVPFSTYVQEAIMRNLELWPEAKADRFAEAAPCYAVIEDAYMAATLKTVCWTREANPRTALRAAFTPMHGVGKDMTARILREWHLPAAVPVPEQIEPHPDFPTVKFPNPEEKGALDLAIRTAEAGGLGLVFAEDPDSDRFACAEKHPATGAWRIFTGNEIGLLLASWALKHEPKERRKDGVMLASTVSSKVLRAMAHHPEDGGFTFEETLTGFKWLGNRAIDLAASQGKHLIFAYEVEIGFLVGDMSYDKDGIRALACFYEMAADLAARGVAVQDHLEALYDRYGHFQMTNSYVRARTAAAIPTVFARLRKDGKYATSIAGVPVKSVRDLTTGYDSAQPDGKAVLYVDPTAHMITYTLQDGSTVTLRTSGTEPKLKYYVETVHSTSKQEAVRLLDVLTKAVLNDLIQPHQPDFD